MIPCELYTSCYLQKVVSSFISYNGVASLTFGWVLNLSSEFSEIYLFREEFIPFLLVSKGKKLIARLLPFLKHDSALTVLRIVTSNLPTLMSRDTEEVGEFERYVVNVIFLLMFFTSKQNITENWCWLTSDHSSILNSDHFVRFFSILKSFLRPFQCSTPLFETWLEAWHSVSSLGSWKVSHHLSLCRHTSPSRRYVRTRSVFSVAARLLFRAIVCWMKSSEVLFFDSVFIFQFGLSLLYALLSQGEKLLSSGVPLEPSIGDFEMWWEPQTCSMPHNVQSFSCVFGLSCNC